MWVMSGVAAVRPHLATLMMGLLPMLEARSANLRVDTVSSKASPEGDTVEMMVVRQFPPRESCNRSDRGIWKCGAETVWHPTYQPFLAHTCSTKRSASGPQGPPVSIFPPKPLPHL